MPSIQPIETWYAGCRFRSRLEARWAVFFDTLNIKWEYEPQGFRIGGQSYLPDFLLTECGTWIEVKGDSQDLDIGLMHQAARELPAMPWTHEPGPRLMILGPIPRPSRDGDWVWTGLEEKSGPPWRYGFALFRKNQRPWGAFGDVIWDRQPSETAEWLAPHLDPEEQPEAYEAYAQARSARFEHGEKGETPSP